MKRDWDLIRRILTEAESKPAGEGLSTHEVKDVDLSTLCLHIKMLHDAGYVVGRFKQSQTGPWVGAAVMEITLPGYDLLDTIRSDSVWRGITKTAKEKGLELTFEAVKQIGKHVLDCVIQGKTISGISL